MKLSFNLHKKKTIAKEKRFNPHHFWIWSVGVFLMCSVVLILVLSWYFIQITNQLDTPATPTLATNAKIIEGMQRKIEAIDGALKARVGDSGQ